MSEGSIAERDNVEGVEMHAVFRDREQAQRVFGVLEGRLSSDICSALPDFLSKTPDPDLALLMMERLVAECGNVCFECLNRSPALIHYAICIFGQGPYLGDTLLRNPDLLVAFESGNSLDRSYSQQDFQERLSAYRERAQHSDVPTMLAAFKRREYVRIFLRDYLRIASLAETTHEISVLSDVLIGEALREAERNLRRKYPLRPDSESTVLARDFAVLSLGKLGGSELNYSSDVDLMYLFRDGDAFVGASVTAQEYFIRLAQGVTELLSRITTEGPVFRIDLRLRPRGGDGELAISLDQAVLYYTHTAQDWELQALIKARHSAGDMAITAGFVRDVQPSVYTESINFRAIKTALLAREKMHWVRRLRSKDRAIDVKIGHGGIRDIEFVVQCLQRVYGGREPWLRSRGTLYALQKLYEKGHLQGDEYQRLSSAYEFLRHLEHRLQLRHGRQTHTLPTSSDELNILQRSMEPFLHAGETAADLPVVVRARMEGVSEIYKRVILQQQAREAEQLPDFALLGELDVTDATDRGILDRLATDSPRLHELATRPELDSLVRKNLFRFLTAAFTSSTRYASVVDNTQAVERALVIFEESEFLTDILVRHPEELPALTQVEGSGSRPLGAYLFDPALGERRRPVHDPVFAYLAGAQGPLGDRLSLLRRHYRHRMFTEGVRDLLSFRDIYDALAATTSAAEDAISCAFQMGGGTSGLAVMALGRLGTKEFDLGSDADLLFVCTEQADAAALKNAVERIVQTLSSYTQDGKVLSVDMRLRPRGDEGELIVSASELERYFATEAQPWETLLYTKMRFIAGDRKVGEQAATATMRLFERFAKFPQGLAAVREMRSKLEGIHEARNFKTAPGGTYDIDFITSSLLVRDGCRQKNGTLRERVWRCAAAGLLENRDAALLDHAAELLRTTEHAVRLISGPSTRWLPEAERSRTSVQKLVGKMLQRSRCERLEAEVIETCEEVRRVYSRVFAEQD